jgi:caffeoyl-CoA O-methyltransferase
VKRTLIFFVSALGFAAALVAAWWSGADGRAAARLANPQAAITLGRGYGQGFTATDGELLHNLIVERGFKRVLDIGTAHGYSAIWFALAVRKTGGRVVTLEIDPAAARKARENFRDAGVSDRIDSRVADALVEIPRLASDFDFVFMDVGAPLNKELLNLVHTHVPAGGAIAAHNAFSFYFNQREFLKAIRNSPEWETRIVPTRSGGISISVKKA